MRTLAIIVKVRITTTSNFLENQSDREQNRFVFSYTVVISNEEKEAVQLMSRHWIIKDANSKQEEVIGEGVVGEQPIIQPGESYQYTSGAILDTEIGTMEGFYQMRYPDNTIKNATIPVFTLSVPRILH